MGEDGFTTIKSKEPLTREEVFEREASKLANGTKVTLIHFRKIGLDCIDITRVMSAKSACAVYKCKEFSTSVICLKINMY
eukprot:scaffold7100_cov138-Skeletonema_marinoi.AAC.7